MRPDYLLPVRSIVRTLEPQETLLPLRALLPGGLVRCGAGVEAGVEDDPHGAGLLVGDPFPAVPEVLTGDVGGPGEEAISTGAVDAWLRLLCNITRISISWLQHKEKGISFLSLVTF